MAMQFIDDLIKLSEIEELTVSAKLTSKCLDWLQKLLSKNQKYELSANSRGTKMGMIYFKFDTSKDVYYHKLTDHLLLSQPILF